MRQRQQRVPLARQNVFTATAAADAPPHADLLRPSARAHCPGVPSEGCTRQHHSFNPAMELQQGSAGAAIVAGVAVQVELCTLSR